MDRRYMHSGASNSHVTRTSTSFIPTSGVPHTKLSHHQIQQLALHSQLQAQSQLHMRITTTRSDPQHSAQNYYQSAISSNRHIGTLPIRNISTANSANSNLQQQQMPSKHFNKQFSSHYGNLSSVCSNSDVTNDSASNGSVYYGNLVGQNQNSNSNQNWRHPNQPQFQNELPAPTIQPIIKQMQQQNLSDKMSQHYQPAETEGLPQTLVDSMRTLFDILDDTKVGKIRLSDIETRWESNDVNGSNNYKGNTCAEPLIKMGVMGYLRKVTPPDGLLTFDRFCAGLRLALLTTNNNPLAQSQIHLAQTQAQLLNHTNPQFNLQQHVRYMTSNLQNANNLQPNTAASLQASVKSINNNKSDISGTSINNSNNNAQRISKIPSVSASRLPMPNGSGLPVSPNSRLGNIYVSTHHASNTVNMVYQNGNSRPQANGEQGTTIAMVHQAPTACTKSIETSVYSKNNERLTGTLRIKQNSSSFFLGKENRSATKNGSLDNLIGENNEKCKESTNDRPPSAPLLDTTESYVEENEIQYNKNNDNPNKKEEHVGNLNREIEEPNLNRKKSSADEMSFGKRVVSFVTPRQRTLSMPQLQVNKLKPKFVSMDDESSVSTDQSQSPVSSGEVGNRQILTYSKINLKFHGVKPIHTSILGTLKQKPDSTANIDTSRQTKASNENEQPSPPPKPPRNTDLTITLLPNNVNVQEQPLPTSSPGSGTMTPSKPEIRTVLHSWQKEMVDKCPEEARAESILINKDFPEKFGNDANGKGERKTNLRKRETPRRHTVQSGIDFATLKRLKQLEQERDVLQQGTNYIESTRDWYIKQLDMVDEKITLLTKGVPTSDYWSECHEERLNLLGCRISEVNSLLTALMDGATRLPLHMNLQVPSHLSMKTITRLKEQNKLLTQEVSDCSHRVTQLETEKAMLLRQLFHQKNHIHPDETVYM